MTANAVHVNQYARTSSVKMLSTNAVAAAASVTQTPTCGSSVKFPLRRSRYIATHQFPKYNKYNEPTDALSLQNALQRLRREVQQSCCKFNELASRVKRSQPVAASKNLHQFPLKLGWHGFHIRNHEYRLAAIAARQAQCVRKMEPTSRLLKVRASPKPAKMCMFPVKSSDTCTNSFPIKVSATAKIAYTNVPVKALRPPELRYAIKCLEKSSVAAYVNCLRNFPVGARVHNNKSQFPLCQVTKAFGTPPCKTTNGCTPWKFPIIGIENRPLTHFPSNTTFLVASSKRVCNVLNNRIAALKPSDLCFSLSCATASTSSICKQRSTSLDDFPGLKSTYNSTNFPLLKAYASLAANCFPISSFTGQELLEYPHISTELKELTEHSTPTAQFTNLFTAGESINTSRQFLDKQLITPNFANPPLQYKSETLTNTKFPTNLLRCLTNATKVFPNNLYAANHRNVAKASADAFKHCSENVSTKFEKPLPVLYSKSLTAVVFPKPTQQLSNNATVSQCFPITISPIGTIHFPLTVHVDTSSHEHSSFAVGVGYHKRREISAEKRAKLFIDHDKENNNKIWEIHNNRAGEENSSNICGNNNNSNASRNNVNTPAQTMTQSGQFGNEEQPPHGCGGAPHHSEPNHSENQIYLARTPTSLAAESPHKRNDNDVATILARTTRKLAKNTRTARARQQKCRAVRGAQNSRSANLLGVEENMNDVQQQQQQQQQQSTNAPHVKSGNEAATGAVHLSKSGSTHEEHVEEQICSKHSTVTLKNIKNIKFNADDAVVRPTTPPPLTTCSDVCDTSSQVDLERNVVVRTVACETCNAEQSAAQSQCQQQTPAATTSSSQSSSSSSSSSVAAARVSSSNSVSGSVVRVTQHEPRYLLIETQFPSVGVTPNDNTATRVNAVAEVHVPPPLPSPPPTTNITGTQRHATNVVNCVSAAHPEMTLTKVEDQCDEENLSISSSSYLDDNQKQSNADDESTLLVDDTMKYEMKSGKSISATLPSSNSSMLRPNLQQSKIGTRHATSVDDSTSNSSLLAATDLSKLANFGKPRHRDVVGGGGGAVMRAASNDALDYVLPARTLLRRQRRLQTQGSEEKKEDAVERLNRLRARISSTLSEVKGVLQHYSVDEGGETGATSGTQPQTAASVSSVSSRKLYEAPLAAGVTKSAEFKLKDVGSRSANEKLKYNEIKPVEEKPKNDEPKSTAAQSKDNEAKPTEEKPKDDGPITFRFVRKVRRRSVFSEDNDDEQQTSVAKPSVAATIDKIEEATDEVDHAVAKREGAEVNVNVVEKKDNETASEIKQQTAISIMSINEGKITTDSVNAEVKPLENATQKTTEINDKHDTNKRTDTVKVSNIEAKIEGKSNKKVTVNKIAIQEKSDERRASIAAPEASKIEPPIDAAIKSQRRPSDSEAMRKRRNFRAQSNATKAMQTMQEDKKIIDITKVEKQTVESGRVTAAKNSETLVRNETDINAATSCLATVKEEKSSDESATESKSRNNQQQIATASATELAAPTVENVTNDATKKPKKRSSLKAKEPTTTTTATTPRRASVAAAELSQIEPPVKAAIPLGVKAQRRPSDSEAVVKRKVPASEADAAAPKVKTVAAKVKRPSVKSNFAATNSHKDAAQSAPAPAAIALPTQSAISIEIEIDDAATASAQKVKQFNDDDDTCTTKVTAKDAQSATKLDGQRNETIATLASPLRAVEANSCNQASTNAIVTTKQLVELVNETVLVTHISKSSDNSTKTQTEEPIPTQATTTSATSPATEIPKHCAASENSASAKFINQAAAAKTKALPSDAVHAPPTAQQVSKTTQQVESSLRGANKIDDHVGTTVSGTARETTKTDNASSGANSVNELLAATTTQSEPQLQPQRKQATTASVTATQSNDDAMPELQVVPAPVKPLQVYAENETPKDALIKNDVSLKDGLTKKKNLIKKVRKNSIDKAYEKKKLSESVSQELIENATEESVVLATTELITNNVATSDNAEEINDEDTPAAPAPPKKARKVKKKVIIRRQQRKLSISDAFFQAPTQPEKQIAPIETLEKAIAYVTDDEDDDSQKVVEPAKPLKTCIKQREYQIGDWVMYGERFRKTQIRWKKGRITERITSISYKIDIDGQEVSAHISYIKKYTGRKVNFGGKEYLEIDYEQIAEEERRARTYSIWNAV